jgi:hypothetical protein
MALATEIADQMRRLPILGQGDQIWGEEMVESRSGGGGFTVKKVRKWWDGLVHAIYMFFGGGVRVGGNGGNENVLNVKEGTKLCRMFRREHLLGSKISRILTREHLFGSFFG